VNKTANRPAHGLPLVDIDWLVEGLSFWGQGAHWTMLYRAKLLASIMTAVYT
jgi:hypothetical protein